MTQRLSRRQLLQGSLAALATGAASPAPAETTPAGTPLSPPVGAVPGPRGLEAVTAVLSGVGVYVGNAWYDWDDNARRFAMAKVRGWGFDFISPKVGGYTRTYYRNEGQLRGWVEAAHGIGLGFAPFIYSIPDTYAGDARICAQIARVAGIANVDMEDEWGAREKTGTPGYKGTEMAEFGRIYREEAGDRPIIANGYGDPITRFGSGAGGFPNAEMAAWADAYSPQWYIGVYSRYHKGGVRAALDWVRAEVRQALGPDFPLVPSIALASLYSPDGLLPLPDMLALMAEMRQYKAPVFVWEYGRMTPPHAEALLGPSVVRNVRLGRSRQTSFVVLWDTHVPSRSTLTWRLPTGTLKQSGDGAMNLSHSAGADGLAAGTAYSVTVQSMSGGGSSLAVPLTVATAPAHPGVYAQSVVATRELNDHVVLTVTLLNSAETEAQDVQLTQLSVEEGLILAPAAVPYSVGKIGARDWEASAQDRAELSIVVGQVPAGATTLTLHMAGTVAGVQRWSANTPAVHASIVPAALGERDEDQSPMLANSQVVRVLEQGFSGGATARVQNEAAVAVDEKVLPIARIGQSPQLVRAAVIGILDQAAAGRLGRLIDIERQAAGAIDDFVIAVPNSEEAPLLTGAPSTRSLDDARPAR